MEHKKRKNRLPVLLVIVVAGFIFSNSFQGVSVSDATSKSVTVFLQPVLEWIFGEGNATNHFVRKLAHFAEFGAFGLVLSAVFRRISVMPFFLAMTVGLLDETIQIFTGRGPQVQDVWLDFAGACVGYLTGLLVQWFMRVRREEREAETSSGGKK